MLNWLYLSEIWQASLGCCCWGASQTSEQLEIFKPESSILQSCNKMSVCLLNTGQGHGAWWHYSDVILGAMMSQITSLVIVYWTVYSDTHQRKHQSSASLAFVWGIHRWPVNSPHKGSVTWKMLLFDDDVIMINTFVKISWHWNASHITDTLCMEPTGP